MNYDLVVDVTLPGSECFVSRYIVWDNLGTKYLTESTVLDRACQ